MTRILMKISLAAAFLGAVLTSCQEEGARTIGKEYILFQDTLSIHPVLEDENYSFSIPVTSTTACGYDRTIAVEVIDEGSNAVEGRDYRLASNTVTIPAGQYTADVVVYPQYDRFGDTDTLSFNLRLVMPDQLRWDLYGDQTKVSMVKSCTFHLEDFTGYCVVTSLFLMDYPGIENASYSRLCESEIYQGKENTILIKDWLFDGYDVTVTFDPSDPANPLVSMDADQQISDEESVFGTVNGDNRILAEGSRNHVSYFNACQNFVSLWTRMYVNNLDGNVGTVGFYYNVMEWISEEEADSIRNEGL